MIVVSEIMKKDVVSFRPETTLGEVIHVLRDLHISGAPVVSADNTVIGVISELALLDVLFEPNLKSAELAPYMTTDVHTVAEDTSLTQAVHMFLLYRVRRLPVVREGKLVGIVSRRDLLALCEKLEKPLQSPLQELMLGAALPSDGSGSDFEVSKLVDLA